jgi:TRAP-type uncharacterized transport system fused permease subunit
MIDHQESGLTPPVWRWYVAYCVAMALLYLFISSINIYVLLFRPTLPGEYADWLQIQAVIILGACMTLFVLYGAAPFLPKRPWAWVYGIVVIAIGMTGLCCLPAAIPLLIFWINPETRAFFGRS